MNKIFSWTRIIIIIVIGLGIGILIPKIVGLKETWDVLREVKYWALFLALLSESFFYIGSTILTRTVLKMTGDRLSFYNVLKISIMDSFSVQFLPLGSFGETAVDYYFYRAKNIRTSHIVLMFISRTIIIWIIFAFIYLLGVAFAPTNNDFGNNHILTIWIIYFLALIFFTYLISLFYRQELLLKRSYGLLKFANWFLRLFHREELVKEKVPETINKVYQATHILAGNRNLQISAVSGAMLFWALAINPTSRLLFLLTALQRYYRLFLLFPAA